MSIAPAGWGRTRWLGLTAVLSVLTLLVHGFHPWAEDGGLYAAGVKWLLNPALFPHDTAFVREHLRFSVFAPFVAAMVRALHLRLAAALLLIDLASTFATLWAARGALRRCGFEDRAQLAGMALLAAWWTMPVAGTSLMLNDPYVTARSISMPLAMFALGWALDDWHGNILPAIWCLLALAAATIFHPLMAMYAIATVVAVRLARSRRRAVWLVLLTAGTIVACCEVQLHTLAEPWPEVMAADSRYYWFLSQWHWYEWAGLLAPLVLLFAIARDKPGTPILRVLLYGAVSLGMVSVVMTLLFAHEAYAAHPIARVQPLRVFVLLYALLAMLSGAWLQKSTQRTLWLCPALIATSFAVFFIVQRASFPASPHIEWPGREAWNANPWVQAFLWARANTPRDALFALDARYVNTGGEDAQTFRAIAERSMLPDYSKDGGEAAITPSLANAWMLGAAAQDGLSALDDEHRDARLLPLGVTWMVLHADAPTRHTCPYRNATVKVCRLSQ